MGRREYHICICICKKNLYIYHIDFHGRLGYYHIHFQFLEYECRIIQIIH
jgi:hypothetical protein